MEFVRADALLQFDELVRALGGNPDRVLRSAGLDPPATRMSGRFVPHKPFCAALEAAAETLATPDFGMRLARRQSLHVLGPMALAMQNAQSLGDMLLLAERYIRTHDQALHFSYRRVARSHTYIWNYALRVRGARSVVQNCELVAALACSVMAGVTGGVWAPREIRFTHQALAGGEQYAQHFPCPVRFGQAANGIVMDQQVLDAPVPGRSESMATLARNYLLDEFGDGTLSLARQVERLIRPLLPSGHCHHAYVAQLFAVHPRTLHRRLAAEGTSFAHIKDAQRCEWAAELLGQGLPAGHVSGMLGYEHDSAFSRSCVRWFGRSPRMLTGSRSLAGGALDLPSRPGVPARSKHP